MSYFTAVLALTLMALAVLAQLVRENNRMSPGRRRLIYAELGLIGAAALAEWLGVALSEVPGMPAWAILLVKWADYVLTPLTGGAIAWQLRVHNRWEKMLNAILIFNVVFQTFAFATGQMLMIDESNHYSHTGLHAIYVAIYLSVFFIIVVQFILYGRTFERQNRGSLYMTVALAIGGVLLQECLAGEARVAYLSLTLGVSFLYIRNGEFFQQVQDESIESQRELLMVDALTGVGSRHAYTLALEHLAEVGMPSDLTAFCADINGLKEANDTHGHAAGDELIRAAADCIRHVLSPKGDCYRTGGDEFVALVHMRPEEAEEAMDALEAEAARWQGPTGQTLHLACGFARVEDWPDARPEELVTHADHAMYDAKQTYYRTTGRNRRHS